MISSNRVQAMLDVLLRFEDGAARDERWPLPLDIGRDPAAGLRLKSWRVARRHARLERREAGVFLEDHGSLWGTIVNGRRVSRYGPLHAGDEIVVGPCLICLRRILPPAQGQTQQHPDSATHQAEAGPGPAECGRPDAVAGSAGAAFSGAGGSAPSDSGVAGQESGGGVADAGEPSGTCSLDVSGAGRAGESDSASDGDRAESFGAASTVAGAFGDVRPDAHPDALPYIAASRFCAGTPDSVVAGDLLPLRRRLHHSLLDALDLRRRDVSSMSDAALRSEAMAAMGRILAGDTQLPAGLDRHALARAVVDEAVGLGVLEPLLADASISEIMVNRHDEIYVEARGRLQRLQGGFSSEQAVLGVIERIVSPLGRRIDESSPMVDARLRDGSRVNAVIPPLALRGACLTIRKFPKRRLAMGDLLRAGALDACMAEFLRFCVRQRKNLIVSGGTGSGKTTLLNVLSNCIPAGERIVTIEDAAELRLDHAHLVALEARPPNLEGRGRVDIRDLVRNALRMRPDRIVVGECRAGEAFDMLAAMNTGHEGSLTTLHANSPRDALARLETMILMAGMDLPLPAIRDQVASSIDIIVQQARLADGRRLIVSIVEVTGVESGRIQTQELFRYQEHPERAFMGCGVLPEFAAAHRRGAEGLDPGLFNQCNAPAGGEFGADTADAPMAGYDLGFKAADAEEARLVLDAAIAAGSSVAAAGIADATDAANATRTTDTSDTSDTSDIAGRRAALPGAA
ncbi:ATPase, T2SS/T4P/T4SS family [Candidimonas nitroreducens]|nr:ATPase, T2SS/T4P/T4SS family [Candidimonas nitroreducens]